MDIEIIINYINADSELFNMINSHLVSKNKISIIVGNQKFQGVVNYLELNDEHPISFIAHIIGEYSG